MTSAFPGIRGQTQLDDLLDFSGTITTGGAAQLLLPQQPRRQFLSISNVSSTTTDVMYVGIGPPRCTATLSSGGVSAIAAANNGIGYTIAPQVVILGGVYQGDYETAPGSTNAQGVTVPGRPAVAHATISGGALTGIVIDDPGAGYLVAPVVYLMNPFQSQYGVLGGGATIPAANNGIPITNNQTFTFNGSLLVPTSAIAIIGPTTGGQFTCKVGGLV